MFEVTEALKTPTKMLEEARTEAERVAEQGTRQASSCKRVLCRQPKLGNQRQQLYFRTAVSVAGVPSSNHFESQWCFNIFFPPHF